MAWATGVDPAAVLSVYSTGYGVGPNVGLTREDLLDLITNIDPWDNIVFAMLPKRRAKSTTHEWPVDTLPTVARTGVPDGAAFAAQGMTAPYRLKNYTQIFRWDVSVTGTEAEVDTAGIGDKIAYQILNGTHAMAKAAEQRIFDIGTGSAIPAGGAFTLDLGNTLVSVPAFGAGSTMVPGYGGTITTGASNTGRRMAPLFQLVAQTGLPAQWTYPFVDMANATLTATKVDDVCEIMFGNGLSPETLVLNHGSKRDLTGDIITASGYAAANTRFIQASERKLIRGVDVYEGELCTLSIIPNRSVAVPASGGTHGYGMAWVLQKDKLGIAFLRPIKSVDIAVRGDSKDKMLIGEWTLENLHPVGAGGVARVGS
jgi:hypothetical protein